MFKVVYYQADEEGASLPGGITVGERYQEGEDEPTTYCLVREELRAPGRSGYRLIVKGEPTHGLGVPTGTPWAHVLDWAHTEIFRDGRVAAGGERFPPFVRDAVQGI